MERGDLSAGVDCYRRPPMVASRERVPSREAKGRRRTSSRCAAAALALAGCTGAAPAAAPEAGCGTAPVARFSLPSDGTAPAPFEIPFPSDVYRRADGTLADLSNLSALGIQRNTNLLAAAFRDLDGFGRNSGAMFVVDDPTAPCGGAATEIDPASLADAAFLLDLEPATPDAVVRVPVVAGWQPRFRTITVQPDGVVLAPGHRYAAVLTTGVRARGGAALSASPAFAAIRDGARTGAVAALYGPAIDRAVAGLGAGFDRGRIAAMAVFTTHTRHRQLHAAAGALRAGRYGDAPALVTDAAAVAPYTAARFGAHPHPGWNATLEEWLGPARRVGDRDLPGWPDETTEGPGGGMAHDALGAIITGTFAAPDFRGPDGAFTLGPDGAPTGTPRVANIPVTFALPRGPVPAAGFPVVIWGHGLSSQRRSMLAVVNELARHGLATAAIDVVTFGQRAYPVDVASLQAGSYRGPDGFGDQAEYSPVAFFGNLRTLPAMRDNLRQAVLDFVQLRRLVGNASLDLSFAADEYGGRAPSLDRAHVAYVADSLGGVLGTMFAAVEPGVDPFVLNVPGGAFFTAVATDAPTIGVLVGTVPPLLFGAPSDAPIDRFHPVMNLLQMAIDGADPACFAAEVTRLEGRRPHDVWVVESLWDEVMSNRSTDLLALAMGLPQMVPARAVPGLTAVGARVSANLAGGATGAFFQCVPCTHGGNIAGRYSVRRYETPFPRDAAPRFPALRTTYRVREPIVAYQTAIADFLTSAFAGSAAISVEAMPTLHDLDDDGWTDAEEDAAGTSTGDPTAHPGGAPPHTRDVGF